MRRILVIEDSPDCQLVVRSSLASLGELFFAQNSEEAKALLSKNAFDLLVIDVNLPDGNGFELCSLILAQTSPKAPRVLFLTGNSELKDKLLGFSVGADDYIVKPFEPLELRARAQKMLVNKDEMAEAAQNFVVGNLRLQLRFLKAEILGEDQTKSVDLTPTEFKLLHCLASQEGQVFSRDQLLYNLSEGRAHVLDRTIDSHLSRTRKKLSGCTHNVESIYGVGYRFVKTG
jgi:DNA-binding response OmpR family regulator